MSYNNGNTYSKSYSRNNKRPLFGKRSPNPQSLARPPPPKRIRTDSGYQSNMDNISSHRVNSNDQPGHTKSRGNNNLSRYNDTSFQTSSRYQGSRYNNNNTSYENRPKSIKRDETKAEFLSHLPKGPKSVEKSRYNNSSNTSNDIKNGYHASKYYNHKGQEGRWPTLYDMPWFFMIMPQQTTKYVNNFSEKFKSVLPSSKCLQLAINLLCYDQTKRFSATEALQSDYFKEEPKPEPLVLDGLVSCHEYEVKLARKQKRPNILSTNTNNKGNGNSNNNNNYNNNYNNNNNNNDDDDK
ncbi:AVN_HP_G0025700.mRNA.1.CDS.1 [Saccharomyces cerevisiae]|nr:AVN_HP_G0025700.mRNA.1.CDS.1 [Saccharomyces cerevisiae]CAI6768993.1 ANM_collapsed_G0032780.mRNA.1.CDS.1 [Saccharomyces cerevisiae]CAI6791377.1 AVN_HP_G0025700.mRNA.1.CDS.1 [Saccharomyces cerevisiae]